MCSGERSSGRARSGRLRIGATSGGDIYASGRIVFERNRFQSPYPAAHTYIDMESVDGTSRSRNVTCLNTPTHENATLHYALWTLITATV